MRLERFPLRSGEERCRTAVPILAAWQKLCHPVPECTAAALCNRPLQSILSSTSLRSIRAGRDVMGRGWSARWEPAQRAPLPSGSRAGTPAGRRALLWCWEEVEVYGWACEGGGFIHFTLQQEKDI